MGKSQEKTIKNLTIVSTLKLNLQFGKFQTGINHRFLATQLISTLSYNFLWVKLISAPRDTCERKWTKKRKPLPSILFSSYSLKVLFREWGKKNTAMISFQCITTTFKPTNLGLPRFYWTQHNEDKKHVWCTTRFQTILKSMYILYQMTQKCAIKWSQYEKSLHTNDVDNSIWSPSINIIWNI